MIFAEEMPVRVKADNLRYDQEAGIITATGSVEIHFEDNIIRSDSARIDTSSNVATAEGHVKIEKKDYSISAGSITYDISGETAAVFKLRTVFYPSDIKANVYLSAYRLYDLKEYKNGEYGSITTCDYEDPHYRVESRWFDYYPDDKIVGYLVTFYGGPVPMLWTPYYVFNLKERKSPYSFIYGSNDVEGKFLKTSFDYFVNNSAHGTIYVDSTEIKGPGYGILHNYKLDPSNSGNLYLYTMYEQDTHIKDYAIKWNHNIQLDQFSKLTLIHNSSYIYLIPAGRQYQTSSSIGYSRDTGPDKTAVNASNSDDYYSHQNTKALNIKNTIGSMTTGFDWNYSSMLSGQKWKKSSDRFYHDQKLFNDNGRITLNVNYSSYVTDEGFVADEKLEPRIDFTYKGSFYSLKLVQNWYEDLDGRRFRGDDNYEFIERLPELEVAFNPVDLYYFNMNLRTGFARYHEAKFISAFSRMRNMTANRYMLGAGISRSDYLGWGSTLRLGLGLEQYAYDTGDQRYSYSESANLSTDLGGFFRNKIDWGRTRVDGNTPFFFETLGSQSNYIKDNITLYYMNTLSWDISGGYNYLNSTYDDVRTILRVTPDERLSVQSDTGWSIENQRYLDLNISASFTPWPKFTNTGGIAYDLNVGRILSANSVMDLEIGDTWEDRWHFKVGHTYDPETDLYLIRDVAIVKDLHCWEAVFTYNDYRKEFRFGMTLKAFPSFPISYVSGDSGSYFDGFMNNMHFEQESPRRY